MKSSEIKSFVKFVMLFKRVTVEITMLSATSVNGGVREMHRNKV